MFINKQLFVKRRGLRITVDSTQFQVPIESDFPDFRNDLFDDMHLKVKIEWLTVLELLL